jgi:formylglycine-generating enzyme required for sulfatase activity
MKTIPLLAAAALAAAAFPALAQTPVKAGDRISGQLTSASPRFSPSGNRYDCYVLPTTPGSRWIIEMISPTLDTLLQLAVGEACEGATVIRHDDDSAGNWNSRLIFNAGGGSYILIARTVMGTETGEYTLTVRQEAGEHNRGRMVPGREFTVIEPVSGTASTILRPLPQDRAGQVIKDCATCPEMVVVPAGSFMMGSPATEEGRQPSEGPRHLVTINRAFAIGKFELTFDEYDACVADSGCRQVQDQGYGRGRHPVVNVNYQDAMRYVAWLSKTTGQAYFIPSEAEWEYAARAGTDTPWNTGSAILSDDANILDQFKRTVVVGGYPANPWGLHDTHGNVAEWVQDCMDTGYVGVPTDGSAAQASDCDNRRIVRDGSFAEPPHHVRSAMRRESPSRSVYSAQGFRVARGL